VHCSYDICRWNERLPAFWRCCFDCNCTSAQFLPYLRYALQAAKRFIRLLSTMCWGPCDAKDHCRRESGSDCSDLGSAHVWNVAQRLSIPIIPVRSISDTKNSETPFSGDMLKFILETLDAITLRLIRYLLRHAKDVTGIYLNSLTGIQRSKASRRGWAAGNNPAHRKNDHTKNRLAISWIDE
jgi:hypothetical protein